MGGRLGSRRPGKSRRDAASRDEDEDDTTRLGRAPMTASAFAGLRSVRIGPRDPEHVIVMLGDAGQSPEDLALAADALVARTSGAAAVILGPAVADPTWRWFPEADGQADAAAIQAALDWVWPEVLKAAKAEGCSSSELSVFGFGQGATLALAAAAAGYPFVCALALAGRLVGDLKARRARSPDLFISYGEDDLVMPPGASQAAAEAFCRRGYSVALIPAPRLGREIALEQLHHAASFLRGAIVGREPILPVSRAGRAKGRAASVTTRG